MAITANTSRALRSAPPTDDEDVVVELPAQLPRLTPGLARALLAAITSAAVNVGLLEGTDDEAAERLAS